MATRKKPEPPPPVYHLRLSEEEFTWVADIVKAKKMDAEKRDYAKAFPRSWDLYLRLEATVQCSQEQADAYRVTEQARIDEEWENRPRRRVKT